jgi:hypothetical protein
MVEMAAMNLPKSIPQGLKPMVFIGLTQGFRPGLFSTGPSRAG